MKVEVIAEFYDREANLKLREIGEAFEVDPERAEKLAYQKLVKIHKGTKKKKGDRPEAPVEA